MGVGPWVVVQTGSVGKGFKNHVLEVKKTRGSFQVCFRNVSLGRSIPRGLFHQMLAGGLCPPLVGTSLQGQDWWVQIRQVHLQTR